MKKLLPALLVISMANCALSQSDSYETFNDTFRGDKDVHSFNVGGWLARLVLKIADEHEFRYAITDIKNIRLTEVPRARFLERGVTVEEFKKTLKADLFQELAHVCSDGDVITVYIKENAKRKRNNLYFILVEESDEVSAVEMRGYIDAEALMKMNKIASLKQKTPTDAVGVFIIRFQ